MIIGIRCNPLSIRNDFPALVRWLADNDFDAVDLMAPDQEAMACATSNGLTIGSFDSPQVPKLINEDRHAAKAAADALKDELSLAADMGLKTLFACFVPLDCSKPRAANFELWKEVVPGVVQHAERLGLRIAMEPWPGSAPYYATLGTTPEMWRAMFEAADSPALGLCYDPSHLVRLGIDYERALDEFGSRIYHVHAKDCAIIAENLYLQGRMPPTFGNAEFAHSEGWWRYCIPGDGVVDWQVVNRKLQELNYTDTVSIELEDHFYRPEADANRRGLLKAKEYLRALG